MTKSTELLLGSLKEVLEAIIKDAVAEALQQQMPQKIQYPEKVGVKQACEITGYSKNTIYQMHSRGQLPMALKVGGKLLFRTEELLAWVEEGGRR